MKGKRVERKSFRRALLRLNPLKLVYGPTYGFITGTYMYIMDTDTVRYIHTYIHTYTHMRGRKNEGIHHSTTLLGCKGILTKACPSHHVLWPPHTLLPVALMGLQITIPNMLMVPFIVDNILFFIFFLFQLFCGGEWCVGRECWRCVVVGRACQQQQEWG